MPMQTILVIDDDENLRDTIGVLLEREGFRAILAADGKTGLDQAILGKPALILADLRLPDLSGVEVCKRLRTSGIQTPIIVLSAVGEEIDKVLLLEIGAAVTGVVLLVAYLLSLMFQRQISEPILALAETASAISNDGTILSGRRSRVTTRSRF